MISKERLEKLMAKDPELKVFLADLYQEFAELRQSEDKLRANHEAAMHMLNRYKEAIESLQDHVEALERQVAERKSKHPRAWS